MRHPRGDSGLLGRLQAWNRYAELVQAQEEAVSSGDLETYHSLARERDRVQQEMASGGADPARDLLEDWAGAGGPERSELEGTVARLRAAAASDRRIQNALRHLRNETRNRLNQMDGRAGGVRTYAREEFGAEGGPGASRLDLRF